MDTYIVHTEYTDIRTYIKKHLGTLYFFDGTNFYRRYKSFIFWEKEKIGSFYALIYNIGNDYQVESSDKDFLDHIKPICSEYEKLTNGYCHFLYKLRVFKEIE